MLFQFQDLTCRACFMTMIVFDSKRAITGFIVFSSQMPIATAYCRKKNIFISFRHIESEIQTV